MVKSAAAPLFGSEADLREHSAHRCTLREKTMDIRHFRYVECIARLSNFSKAANELHITQQTLSQQIAKLEDEAGFAIFERTTRSVRLTEKGRLLLQKAKPVLAAYDELLEEIAQLRGDNRPTIQLGILPTFSSLHALEAVHEFQSQSRGAAVNLQIHRSGTLLDMLLRGKLDAVIANVSNEELEQVCRSCHVEILPRITSPPF